MENNKNVMEIFENLKKWMAGMRDGKNVEQTHTQVNCGDEDNVAGSTYTTQVNYGDEDNVAGDTYIDGKKINKTTVNQVHFGSGRNIKGDKIV